MMQAVYIEWEDASCVDGPGWVDRETAAPAEPHVFRQLGFVEHADEHCIVLTEAYNPTSMAPRTRIPAGMVRRIVDLDGAVKA